MEKSAMQEVMGQVKGVDQKAKLWTRGTPVPVGWTRSIRLKNTVNGFLKLCLETNELTHSSLPICPENKWLTWFQQFVAHKNTCISLNASLMSFKKQTAKDFNVCSSLVSTITFPLRNRTSSGHLCQSINEFTATTTQHRKRPQNDNIKSTVFLFIARIVHISNWPGTTQH